MLFLTASLLGLAAGLTRSAFSVAMVAALLVASFALATFLSTGPTAYFKLLTAVLGYNCGLVGLVTTLAFTRSKSEA
ncbi:hypothetical protein EPK99_13630 [Neorhizobium lilium]|uniref:Uncharacterized protein n=1 Tax=Neorhizobium lilium TaxID=2503024 RepID=A0A444LEX3_9HYPH|nr:hypothetical protein [Neorhizobium lilium]RWX76714.1 hypothetical protein EPK99_13630 [Neorhizobium lilium]